MQRRLQNSIEVVTEYSVKIEKYQSIVKYLEKLLNSPIFMFLKDLLKENIAEIVYDYLDIEFCNLHNTHFPKDMRTCFKCTISHSTYYDQTIYQFRGPLVKKKRRREVDAFDRFIQIDFDEEDSYFKTHLLEQLSPDARIAIDISHTTSVICNTKVWYFVWVGNCWNNDFVIRNCPKFGPSSYETLYMPRAHIAK